MKTTARSLLTCLLLGACVRARAADGATTGSTGDASSPTDTPSAPASAATPDDDITTMAKYTVSDVPIRDQVLPTVRPIGDVMGDDRNIVDTPRSVSSVNEAWMRDRMVKNAMDLGQFSPGVYSAAQYGIPAVPFIRGDLAQMYYGGQIIPFTRNSTPPSFNGVEALDIVKGPGSAVYGPQGEGAGGYVDFIMKQPYFDGPHGDLDATLGYLTSGHSYSNPEFTLDYGAPLSDKLAYRVSYLSRYGDGYYINDHNETQDVYVALSYLATSALRFDWWAQIYSDRTNEISGANRVTQNFIWHGSYVAGPAMTATSGPNAFYGYDIFTTPTPAPGSFPSTPDGSYALINPATAHTIKLPAYDALIGPLDTARSRLFQTQLKATDQIGDNLTILDRTYIGIGASNKSETYGYSEYVPAQDSIQNRLEFHLNETTGAVTNNLIAGGDFRYQHLKSYQDFATEPFNYYDLSGPLYKISYPGYAAEGNTWGGGLQVPGTTGYSAYADTSGTQQSDIYDSAAFVQDDIKLGPGFSIIPGIRFDHIAATTKNPALIQEGYYDDYFDYLPLASPAYIPAGHSSAHYQGFNVSDSQGDWSYFLNLVFKPNENTTFYLTYDHVDAVLGSANFGGVDLSPGSGPDYKAALDRALTTKSTLYEAGFKQSLLKNTLYFSADVFQQVKVGTEITGASFPIKDTGVEAEMVYQPNKRWTFNANVTYQDAIAYSSSFYQQTGNYLDFYPSNFQVDGTTGTNVGSPNFVSFVSPKGSEREPGIPQVMFNAFIEYKDPSGFGGGVGPQWIGRQYANDQDTLHIPGEYELDGYLFYARRNWEVRVNIKNITNERLLDPIDVSFAGNDTIFVRPPISASLTFRYHF